MALTDLPTARPAIWGLVTFIRGIAVPLTRQGQDESPMDDAEEARYRRAFVQNMLNRNPQAFGCEEDVQNMMHMYPGRF